MAKGDTNRNKNRPKKRGKISSAQSNRRVREAQDNQNFVTENESHVSTGMTVDESLKPDNDLNTPSTSFFVDEVTYTSTPNALCDSSMPDGYKEMCDNTSNLHSEEPSTVLGHEASDCSSLLELIIESENSMLPQPFPSSRVICDIGYVLTQARKLEEHNRQCIFNGKLVYSKVVTRCLVHTYTFVCGKMLCGHKETLVTDKQKGCLNQLAVLGAMSTGNGFSQKEQKFSIMNMSYMSQSTYSSSEKTAGEVVEAYAQETMDAAINEENKLASERCDVGIDGFQNICAIVDGGWCKRTYGHGYNASSGVAVIIGAITQKIL